MVLLIFVLVFYVVHNISNLYTIPCNIFNDDADNHDKSNSDKGRDLWLYGGPMFERTAFLPSSKRPFDEGGELQIRQDGLNDDMADLGAMSVK